jgi:phytoene dehydrogenase-like protein
VKRRFRGLRERGPRGRYDAVIVGAGIGGLVCGCLLARSGLQVLLVEQHYMVGGYCSMFRRAGFTFDAATHFYPLLGNPETLTGRLLVSLGVPTRWVKMDPVDVFHLPDGSRFVVPADFDTYLARLKERFPHEIPGIDAFFADVREAYSIGLLGYFRNHPSARFAALESLTLRQAIDRRIADPKLRLVLAADSPHWGSPPERTSFLFDAMLRLSYFLGNYYPEEGSQAFVDDLANRFEAFGGELMTSTRATRLTLAAGAGGVNGLEIHTDRGPLAGHHRVATPALISNADLLATVEQLLPAGAVDEAYLAPVRRLRPSYPCFLTHVGLQGITAQRLAEVQGYYWSEWNADAMGRDALVGKIFSPTLFAPSMAPPGGQIAILQKVLDMDFAAVADWPAHKSAIEAGLLAHLHRVLPEAATATVVSSSASAHTAWRFTLNHQGAMLGWEMAPDQLGARRPDQETPIPGLWLVGHWTRPGGGVTPVIVSAMQVAERLLSGRQTPGVAPVTATAGSAGEPPAPS